MTTNHNRELIVKLGYLVILVGALNAFMTLIIVMLHT